MKGATFVAFYDMGFDVSLSKNDDWQLTIQVKLFKHILNPKAEKGQTNTAIHYVPSSCVRHSSLRVDVVKTQGGLQRKQTPKIISAQSKAKTGEMWQDWRLRPRKKKAKTEKGKRKPIKTYVLSPWRPMSCLKSPGLNLQRPQVRLRGYQPLFGVNYHCLSRYVPLHLNGLTWLMYSRGWKQSANVYQHPRSDFSVHVCRQRL